MEQTGESVNELNEAQGDVITPLATAAALDSSALDSLNPTNATPKEWKERAQLAWNYYLEEPLVKHCVNAWRVFAVGDEIKLASDDEDLKKEAEEFSKRMKLTAFVKDMILQLLVKGDAVGFKNYNEKGNELEELVSVNPVSIKLKYAQGMLTEVKQTSEEAPDSEGIDLSVDHVLHLKWDAPGFSARGNSLVLPAFQSIELLRDYRKAEQAIAKRWTTPFRMIKVGGSYGQKMVMPDQKMLEAVRDMVNKMDMKSGLVVPFYVSVETHGTEGEVLNVEDKVKEVKEDIVVAMGLSRSLVTGDGPNFATASVSLQKMLVMIQEIKQAARVILDWVMDDWMEISGHEDKKIQYVFNDLDPSDANEFKRLLIELYDRKLISRSSLQMKMNLEPDIEKSNRETEAETIDLFDEKQVKPIVDMVMAGVMSVEKAQKILGLDPAENRTEAHSQLDSPSAQGDKDRLCDDCGHFDENANYCRVCRSEKSFDNQACRFFEGRVGPM